MTKAYICDKCGLILSSHRSVRAIYTIDPTLYSKPPEGYSIDLCEKCYADFEREYMDNLTKDGGEVVFEC